MISKLLRTLATALLLPALSVGVVLAVFEVGLRAAGYEAIYEVYSKPTIFWEYDELLGWRHQAGASGLYVGPRPWPIEYEAKVEINSLGLRGPEVGPRQPGELRLLVLGDSMVAAFEVEYEQTFIALLEAELSRRLGRPVRAIDGGVRGYGGDQTLLYFRERGWRLEPDLVLFHHSGNDLVDNTTLHEMRRPFGKSALRLLPDGSLEIVGVPVPRYPVCSEVLLESNWEVERVDTQMARLQCRAQMLLFDRSALFSVATLAIRQNAELLIGLYRFGNPHYRQVERNTGGDPDFDYSRQLTMAILLELNAEVQRRGAELALTGDTAQLAALDNAKLRERGVEVLPLEALDAMPEQVRWKHDAHLNPGGHRIVAEALAAPLEAKLREAAGRSAR